MKVTDDHNATMEKMISISVSNQNEAPSDLNVTAPLQVLENQPVGSIVGQLTAQDPDAITVFTYTLVGGSNDNHLFSIDAMGLFERPRFSITNPTQVFRSGQRCGISTIYL